MSGISVPPLLRYKVNLTSFKRHLKKYNCKFLFPKTSAVGAEGIAKWVKCSPYKYEDLSLESRVHIKMLGLVVNACNPSTGEAENIRS